MKLFVTILERTPAAAIESIRALPPDHDGVEIRAEGFDSYEPAEFRRATQKPIILTHRGAAVARETIERALSAGIDLVDVEWGGELIDPGRTVLSHHDFHGMPDVDPLLRRMKAAGCAHVKIAVTPQNFADNRRLLRSIGERVTVIGMGERGFYSRLLAPFLGSELCFVSASDRPAAPGQISLQRALEIYGADRANLRAERVFAVVGNPAGHSLSPSIHNPLFRQKGVRAAYTIASVGSFREIEQAFLDGELSGLSITAPFKRDAFALAERCGADIAANAREAGVVNTLLSRPRLADNTDVDGFEQLLRRVCGRDRKSAALVGAGGTARAAQVALRRQRMHVTVYNRTPRNGALPLDQLRSFDGEIIINTLPPGVDVDLPLRPGMAYIEAAYGGPRRDLPGVDYYDGTELLQAQALRQHELFMKAFDGS